jgi:hypothetical protein
MADIYTAVSALGLPNYKGLRIPLPSHLNFKAWEEHCQEYEDKMVVDYLKYGFPIGFTGPLPEPTYTNHAIARQHAEHLNTYTDTEVKEGAMLGPFSHEPFQPWCQVNPLLTRDKKDSDSRRVIVDLSFPHPPRHSVNSGTPTDVYDGTPYKLTLPTSEKYMQLIRGAGKGCYLYSADISRAFRQMPQDPASWPLTCIKTEQGFFVDVSLPFGLRWAAMACQRATNVVSHIMQKNGHKVLNYIDDFGGVASNEQQAQVAFSKLQSTLMELGLQEAKHKASAPTQRLQWLGLWYDTVAMTVSIPKDKLRDTMIMLNEWSNKRSATLGELRSLLGKLLHIAQCCKPARLFLGRMLITLRAAPRSGKIQLDQDFQRDVQWFLKYLPSTNGIYIIAPETPTVNHIYVDSSPTAGGGIFNKQCYHKQYAQQFTHGGWSICHLEMINCMVALKLWAQQLKDKCVCLHSDNMPSVNVLQAGRSRDPKLLSCAREVWLICAHYNINLRVEHTPGESLTDTADALSRMHLSDMYKSRVSKLVLDRGLIFRRVSDSLFSCHPEL